MIQKLFCVVPTMFLASETLVGETQKTSEVVQKRFWDTPKVVWTRKKTFLKTENIFSRTAKTFSAFEKILSQPQKRF